MTNTLPETVENLVIFLSEYLRFQVPTKTYMSRLSAILCEIINMNAAHP